MSKITIMKGLPASGKSTRAKEIMEKDGNAMDYAERETLERVMETD